MASLKSQPNVVIIGGGVAGIAAATRLLHNGFENVKIIEAEDRLGGRIHTLPFGKKCVDLGAHWISGEVDNVVYNLVKDLNLITSSGDGNNMVYATDDERIFGSDIDVPTLLSTGQIFQNTIKSRNAFNTLQEVIRSRCKVIGPKCVKDESLLEPFTEWVEMYQCLMDGCVDLKLESAAMIDLFKFCEGDAEMCWIEGGYYNIIEILLGTHQKCTSEPPILLEGRLFLNTEVSKINWSDVETEIICSNGDMHKADHVIITVSLGVLKKKHLDMFEPQLPVEKITAIEGLGFGIINKIYLKFDERWWPENCTGFNFLRTKKTSKNVLYDWEHKIVGVYSEYSLDPTVMGAWICGEEAMKVEQYSDEEVLLACHRVLKNFLSFIYDIPKPTKVVRSKWGTNKHFYGCYSFFSVRASELHTSANILGQPVGNNSNQEKLLFAGEATSSEYYSTVHGALESGWREADRLTCIYT